MLSQRQVEEIYVSPLRTSILAAIYGVSTHTIRAIKRQQTHASVTAGLVRGEYTRGNRRILDDATVIEIYKFSGTPKELFEKYRVSKKVAMNIKFGFTYSSVTAGLGFPGEFRLHKLTWDDVCSIRAVNGHTGWLSDTFGVSESTIRNIIAGRTRTLK